jgi:OmpA-OmpF porin, OOP family
MRLYLVKFLILFCALLFNSTTAKCQNLVPNPSFEDTLSCPTTANQLDKCANWWSSRGSPDYFHECDFITGNTAVPENFIGFQHAKTGKAYVGFIAYYRAAPNQREFITCELTSPLKIGSKYQISFYISLADDCYRLASNKTGFLFSTSNYSQSNQAPILNFAHIYSNIIVSDTMNWFHFQGVYVSDSNYTHLSVGNFFDDLSTDTIYLPPASFSYYYLDDLIVQEDTSTVLFQFPDSHLNEVFPNPSNGIFNILASEERLLKLELIKINGQQIKIDTLSITDGTITIDIRNLSSGFYYLNVVNESTVKQYKLLKL